LGKNRENKSDLEGECVGGNMRPGGTKKNAGGDWDCGIQYAGDMVMIAGKRMEKRVTLHQRADRTIKTRKKKKGLFQRKC